ncbi:transcription factor RF2b-like [Cornus florida]|uniref:transcription factor RF2b-like n=1 Tax=Cornus florida TaxID=4283 RepID=UPI00289848AA|nr:transcription factor RF2b-like [Cornus florida]
MSIQMQNPSSISNLNNPDSNSNSNSISSQHDSNYPSPAAAETEAPFTMHNNANHYRRAFSSDDFYRILDDDMGGFSGDPFGDWSTQSVEGVSGGSVGGRGNLGCVEEKRVVTRHRNSNSVDGSSRTAQSLFGEMKESKKAIPPQQLAQLWALDPKRAKRILANRQSAARSKERKARYISELERKVQMVQEEAATHCSQLTLFKRETMTLASENTKLKLRLQAMEQQVKMRDAMNEALMQEVERLKISTGANPSESLNPGMSVSYSQSPSPSTFFSLPQQPLTSVSQLTTSHDDQPAVPFYLHPEISQHLDFSQDDSLGCLQGFDISNIRSNLLEIEG